MSALDWFDEQAEIALDVWRNLHNGLRSSVALFLDGGRVLQAAPHRAFLDALAYDASLARASCLPLSDEVRTAASMGAAAGGARDAAQEMGQLIAEELSEGLRQALLRAVDTDVARVRAQVGKLRMRIALSRMGGMNEQVATRLHGQGFVRGLALSQPDRLGRRYPSAIHARTAVRGALVLAYVRAFLAAQVAQGRATALAAHPDGTRERFSILGEDTTLPSFEDVEHLHWHPNSRTQVMADV